MNLSQRHYHLISLQVVFIATAGFFLTVVGGERRLMEVVEGDTVILKCPLSWSALSSKQMTWTMDRPDNDRLIRRDDGSVTIFANNQQIYGNTDRMRLQTRNEDYSLNITNVSQTDEANYTCTRYHQKGKDTSYDVSVTYELVVNAPPTITDVSEDMLVDEGQSVMLTCIASGKPTPSISWTREIPSGDERGTSSYLPLTEVTRDSAGKYICRAANKVQRNVHRAINLQVMFKPTLEVDETTKSSISHVLNSSPKLSCVFSGYPNPAFEWTGPDGKIIGRSDKVKAHYRITSQRIGVISYSYLQIFVLKPSDFGNYTCLAVSSKGRAQQTFTLNRKTNIGFPATLGGLVLAFIQKGISWLL